jgi:hypothetical protein
MESKSNPKSEKGPIPVMLQRESKIIRSGKWSCPAKMEHEKTKILEKGQILVCG